MPIPRVKRGQVIEADHFNALVDAINAMELRVAAPLVMTKTNSGGQVIALGFGYDEICVCELTADLADDAGVRTATAKILWDKDQAGTWDIDADTDEIDVYAATNMTGATGDRCIAKFDRQSGLWLLVDKDC